MNDSNQHQKECLIILFGGTCTKLIFMSDLVEIIFLTYIYLQISPFIINLYYYRIY